MYHLGIRKNSMYDHKETYNKKIAQKTGRI